MGRATLPGEHPALVEDDLLVGHGLEERLLPRADDAEAEGCGAADVAALAALGGAAVLHPLADALALQLGERGRHGEEARRHPALGDGGGAHVEQDELDPLALEVLGDLQGVERRAEHAIELGGDDGVAAMDVEQQVLAGRALVERGGAAHGRVGEDQHRILVGALHHGEAAHGALLLLRRGAVHLLLRRDAGVTEDHRANLRALEELRYRLGFFTFTSRRGTRRR